MNIREHINLVTEGVHGDVTPKVVKIVFREENSGSDGLTIVGVPVEVSPNGQTVKMYVLDSFYEDGSPNHEGDEWKGKIRAFGSDLSQYHVVPN